MHFEILVEDMSGKRALELIVPNIIGDSDTFRVISYKGVGHIPKGMKSPSEASKRILLANLPRLLSGYGNAYASSGYGAAVFVILDLDDRSLSAFGKELLSLLARCKKKPETRFCIAIEEGEAWLLGDIPAVKKAYPDADTALLKKYKNDSICGTWEFLANAVYPGGAQALARQGWHAVGAEKSRWAERIAPHMDVDRNRSPSFQSFRQKLRDLASTRHKSNA